MEAVAGDVGHGTGPEGPRAQPMEAAPSPDVRGALRETAKERQRLHLPLTIATGKKVGSRARRPRPGGIKRMTEAEVAKRYRLGEQVMESTNAGMEVVNAIRLDDGLHVVIKTRKRPESFKTVEVEREWRRTTEMQLGMPKTDRLCEYYEVLETENMYYVVMERVEGKDLFEVMGATKPALADAREIVRQTLEALAVLHGHGRIHKDLKIENVMVDLPAHASPRARDKQTTTQHRQGSSNIDLGDRSPATTKLIDFDTVEDWEPTSPKAKEVLGTDGYIAPEAYLGQYSPASDIYAAGVVMYKVLVGDFPTSDDIFDDQPGQNWVGSPQMERIYQRLKSERIDFARPPLDQDHAAADLCTKLLSFDLRDRPSAEEALRHDWFLVGDRSPQNRGEDTGAGNE